MRLDPDWLRGKFGLTDCTRGGVAGVEIPYLGFGDQRFGGHVLMTDKNECRLEVDKPHDVLHDAVYGVHLLERYTADTVWVGQDEADLYAARLHGLQCLVLPGVRGMRRLVKLVFRYPKIRRLVLTLLEDGEVWAEDLARQLKESGWKGTVLEVVPKTAVGSDDLSDLHVKVDGDPDAFREAVERLSAAAKVVDPVVSHKPTDCGNAKRFVEQHGRDLRYHVKRERWMAYDGSRWAMEESGEEQRRAKATARSIYHEAAEALDGEDKVLAQWAARSESLQRIEAMLKLAATEPGVAVHHGRLDADPFLLNVVNGTIDLRTGKLRLHSRDDLLTRLCPVDYDPRAACPTWDELLDLVTGGNKELQAYLQRAAGYTLTGDTGEECLFFAYGHGKNGKSTFMETLGAILGDYSAKTLAESLMTRRSGGISNDIARLDGPRFVLASELEENRRWSEALVKDLTGNDTITARFLHKEFFEFKPKFKIWCYGNHKPNVGGTDTGFWRRMRLIPFTVEIPESKRVSRSVLDKRLRAEWPGILAWAVRGCLLWQEQGLGSCPEVEQATAEYRAENDVLAEFLKDACVVMPNVRTRVGDLYRAYDQWAKDSGVHYTWTKLDFGKRMREKGFVSGKSTGGQVFWSGVTTQDPNGWEHPGRRDEALAGYATLPADPHDLHPAEAVPVRAAA